MISKTSYGYNKVTSLDFPTAVQHLTDLLKKQGFGILTTIDVKAKMKEKAGVDMDEYLILGACNPQLASQALQAEKELGLLMPCNALVYRHEGKTIVSVQLPSTMMSITGNREVCQVAEKAEIMLKSAIDEMP